jgi:hypothetical protein
MPPLTPDFVILFIVAALLALLGTPTLFQWIKHALKLADKWAVLLILILSFLFSFLALWISGMFTAVSFTPENLMGTFGLIFTWATFTYKILMGSPDKNAALAGPTRARN